MELIKKAQLTDCAQQSPKMGLAAILINFVDRTFYR